MKVKLLIGIALSSLFATSISVAASTMDGMDDTSDLQTLAMDTTQSNDGMQSPGTTPTNVGSGVESSMPGNSGSTSTTSGDTTTSPSTSPNTNDDMSADTATGDDDY
jgi:hypothetical protein